MIKFEAIPAIYKAQVDIALNALIVCAILNFISRTELTTLSHLTFLHRMCFSRTALPCFFLYKGSCEKLPFSITKIADQLTGDGSSECFSIQFIITAVYFVINNENIVY